MANTAHPIVTTTEERRDAPDRLEERRLALRIASDVDADVRTVLKLLRGHRVRGVVAERIRRALAAHGAAPATWR